MVKLSVDLNEPEDSSKTDKAAQNDMAVKLGYDVEYLMYCYFLILSLGLDYGLHSLNVDVDVLEMSKYVKDYKIMLVYVEHGTSNVDTSVVDPFDGLDEILGDYANTGKQITRDESTWKQMVVHVSTSSTTDDFSFGKFKKVKVEAYTESEEEESDTERNDTSGSDSEDLDYDPKHDDVFDDDEHIVEEVHVNVNSFSFTKDPKHDTSIGVIDVQEDDLNVIDYDSFGSDLDDEIDSKRRIQLRELRRISKQKNKGGPAIRENINSGKQNILGRAKYDLLINNICEIVVVHKVIAKTVGPLAPFMTKMFDGIKKGYWVQCSLEWRKWELTGIPCKHVVAAIYNMSKNLVGVGIPEQWVYAAYRLETWAHKPLIGRPPKKRKKSNDEIASQSASSGKLSRKGKSVIYGKCGNVGHNRKGCRVQSGGSSQVGARKVSGQAAGSRKVSGQAAGARNVSGQPAGARNVFGQAAGARKASSQPSAAQSTANQGPKQGFQ
nr:hypothetical protein [Tanacetum cinerariifolium]